MQLLITLKLLHSVLEILKENCCSLTELVNGLWSAEDDHIQC